MKFLSICSGIEAASCAWEPFGWEAVAFAEIEPFPSAVLAHHYPDVPNLGDMTKFNDWPDYAIDLLCGGTPCQSFSVAGLRAGLADPRGDLMLTFLAIAARYRPKWVVWENVPGVLSSNGGRDFGTFLGGLAVCGYGFAYRVLDAQYFGVAQRRRRVFVVGCLGDWRSAAAVLFERHSLQGHPAPSRQAGQRVANSLVERPDRGGGNSEGQRLIPQPHAAISPAIKARDHKGASSDGDGDGAILVPMVSHSLRGDGFDASEDGTGRGTPLVPTYTLAIRGRGDSHDLEYRTDGTANALLTPNGGRGGIGVGAVAFAQNQRDEVRTMDVAGALAAEPGAKQQTYVAIPAIAFDCKASGQNGFGIGEIASTQRAMGHAGSHANGGGHQAVMAGMQVRRLTPRECERLQGFPDDYTLIPHRGKPAADGPRYKALGNSWAVPCARWIGERIHAVEQINAPRKAP